MENYIDFDEPYISDDDELGEEDILDLEIEELPKKVKREIFKEIDEEFKEEEEKDPLED